MSNQEKKSYEVLKPIGFGGRREKGEILNLTEAEAKNFGDEYVKEVGSSEVVKKTVEKKPVDKMTLKELQAFAKELELDVSGSKADLVERITLHLEEEK